jgi:hypothetical protein
MLLLCVISWLSSTGYGEPQRGGDFAAGDGQRGFADGLQDATIGVIV